jgi:hypothetical protein
MAGLQGLSQLNHGLPILFGNESHTYPMGFTTHVSGFRPFRMC